MSKAEVLAVYRRILRVARSWKASSGFLKDTLEERSYIENECRELFRKNSKVWRRCRSNEILDWLFAFVL